MQYSNSTVAFVALAVLLVCFWTEPWCSWWPGGYYLFSQRFFSLAPLKRINILEGFLFFPFAFHFFHHLPLAETLDSLSSICTGTTADPHSDFFFFLSCKAIQQVPSQIWHDGKTKRNRSGICQARSQWLSHLFLLTILISTNDQLILKCSTYPPSNSLPARWFY